MSKRGITPEQAKKIKDQKGQEVTKLQTLRVKKKLTQKQLSIVSGVTQRMIQCYEQQTRPIEGAHLDTLCRLCLALDCKIEDILEDADLIEKFRLTK